MNTLQVFEKKIIANRTWLFNHYNTFIKNLIHKGIYFFRLKINFNYDILIESKKICIDIFKGTAIEFKNPQEYMDFVINSYNNTLFSCIELVDFSYTVIEKSEQENHYHAHIFLCVRAIDPSIESVERHILTIFNSSDLEYEDYLLKPLNNFLDVKNFLIYISKSLDVFDKYINNSYFHIFSTVNPDYDYLISLMDTNCSDNPNVIFNPKIHYNLCDLLRISHSFNGKHSLIRGCNFKKMDQRNIIVYYINLYLKLNNYFFYKSNLYKKNNTSKFSYCYSGRSLKLIELLPGIFKYFDINFDTISFNEIWSNVISNPLYVKEIIASEIKIFRHKELTFNFLEFTDGLFNLEHDLFMPFDDSLFEKTKDLYLIRYYNISYIDSIKNTKPKIWLKFLAKSVSNANDFCTKLGRYLSVVKENPLTTKPMLIHGDFTTEVLLTIKNLLLNAFGHENIGTEFNIKCNNSKLIIIEELNNISSSINALTKALNTIKSNQSDTQIIFIIPTRIKDWNAIESIALKSILNIYYFDNRHFISQSSLNKIRLEEPKIILHCNKLFLKRKKHLLYKRKKEVISSMVEHLAYNEKVNSSNLLSPK